MPLAAKRGAPRLSIAAALYDDGANRPEAGECGL
jgi:hypothetical protein